MHSHLRCACAGFRHLSVAALWLAPWFERLVQAAAPDSSLPGTEAAGALDADGDDDAGRSGSERILSALCALYDACEELFHAFALGGDSCLDVGRDGPLLRKLFTNLSMPHLWEPLCAAFEAHAQIDLATFRPVFLTWLGVDLVNPISCDSGTRSLLDDAEAEALRGGAGGGVVSAEDVCTTIAERGGTLANLLHLSQWEQALWRLKKYPDASVMALRLMTALDTSKERCLPVRGLHVTCACLCVPHELAYALRSTISCQRSCGVWVACMWACLLSDGVMRGPFARWLHGYSTGHCFLCFYTVAHRICIHTGLQLYASRLMLLQVKHAWSS